jgi:hypothetical protein
VTVTLLGRLDQLQIELERLLSFFDAARVPEPAVMDAAWAGIVRSFERVRELPAPAGPDTGVQDRLDRCLRLYAVAAGLLGRRRDELAVVQRSCNEARRRLARGRPSPASGGSCDVRG